jgi:hypothetical protein
MTEYLIAFNDEWVPEFADEDLREASKAPTALRAEMKAAGVLVFTGGLDDEAPVFSVHASSGTPLCTDGPYLETKEHLGGFTVVEVADEDAARLWRRRSPWPVVGRRKCDVAGVHPPACLPARPPERPTVNRDLTSLPLGRRPLRPVPIRSMIAKQEGN